MSILEKIRSRTGLLVGIIGLALIIFVLESLLGSGGALFSGNDTLVGKIAGDKIDAQSFSAKVNEQIAQIQKNNPNAQVDDKMKEQIQLNYNRIKEETKQIVANELQRIKDDPDLCHLLPKEE